MSSFTNGVTSNLANTLVSNGTKIANKLRAKAARVAFAFALAALGLGLASVVTQAQEASAEQNAAARSKDGKKLFGTSAALRVARVSSPRISPDGSTVAYLVATVEMKKDDPGKSVTHLWVVPAASPASAARQFTRGDKSVSNVAWSPDGKIIAFTMEGEDEKQGPQVWFMYANGGEPWQVTKHKSGVRSFEFSPDGKTLLLVATSAPSEAFEKREKIKDDAVVVDHDFRMAQLWTWNIASGGEKEITKGDFTVSDPRWSPDGTHITFTTNPTPLLDDASVQTAWILDVATGQKRKLADTSEYTHTARWSPDGKWIAYLQDHGMAIYRTKLFVVSPDGSAPRELTSSFGLNAGQPVWAPDGKTIYFSTDSRETVEVFAANVESGAVRQVSDKPGVIELSEISKDGQTAIGTWTDPTHPAEVFRSDLGFHSMESITDQNPWLADYALGSAEVMRWKSSKDGMEIDGVVTKPVDFDASRKYPLLLNPHGGPTGATYLSFNPQEQIMAANGYLILEPNFRGSSGRGEKFAQANQNDWGGGDYKDDMSGVQAMVDKGWADPTRMGAFGWSYGGFMTYWIDTQTHRFKAISPGAGLPDLYSMYSQTDIHHYLTLFLGMKAPWDNFQEYWAHSPMKYVENVTTPTMILHGIADTRVPIPQAEEFYEALKERHVPVEFVKYPRENHGFVEPRHIQDRWQRYLVFFGKYLDNPPVTEEKETVVRLAKDLPEGNAPAQTQVATSEKGGKR
ncbi:MAG TPA: S9 family peptidase [Candidatus Acidoferrales bacterium]|nr:S9 family peptidase [Candidatus Acidoferrales bacterium]